MIRLALAGFLTCIFLFGSSSCKQSAETDALLQLDSTATPQVVKITSMLQEDRDNPDLFHERSAAWLNAHKHEKALADINHAIKLDSSKAEYYIHRSSIYEQTANIYEAIADLKKASELDPKKEEAFLGLARVNLFVKNYEQAILNSNKVLELNNQNTTAIFTKGISYKEMNDTAKAIDQFKQLIVVDENFYDAYMQLGIIYSMYNDPKALPYLDIAIRIDNLNPEAYYQRGFFYQNTGQIEKAVADYRKSIELDPGYYQAYYNIGYINFYRDDIDEAYNAFNEAVQRNDKYVKAYYMRGLCHEKLKDKAKARENYLFCLQLDPDFAEAKDALKRLEK